MENSGLDFAATLHTPHHACALSGKSFTLFSCVWLIKQQNEKDLKRKDLDLNSFYVSFQLCSLVRDVLRGFEQHL